MPKNLNPYDYINFLKPVEVIVIKDEFEDLNKDIKFSVVVSVKNEANTANEFIQVIEQQTLLPDEVIIVDHFSTDETIKILHKICKNRKTEYKIVNAADGPQFKLTKRATLAGNRNFGVSLAKNEIIVFVDFGNFYHKNFLKALVTPLLDPEVDLVGGIFHPQESSVADYLAFNWATVNWDSFLPACRAQAVRKEKYLLCSGQAEWLSYAGEDAYYDYFYRKQSRKWVFNLAADAEWFAPKNYVELKNKFFSYGVGDGENGLGNSQFYVSNKNLESKLYLKLDKLNKIKFLGYLEGKNRLQDIDDRRKVKRIIILVCDKHPTICDETYFKIKKYIDQGDRVICLFTNAKRPVNIKYFDFDFSLFEIYYYKDFAPYSLIRRFPKFINNNGILFYQDESNKSIRSSNFFLKIKAILSEFYENNI